MSRDFDFPLRLGFGCSGAWGMPWFDRGRARAVLLKAFEGGVRYVDTAGFYGRGEAETRLGACLKEFREPVFVSTKTGTTYGRGGARKDFSEAAIWADVEASLRRLGLDRLDLLFLHGPASRELEDSIPVVLALRAEGKIAGWGVCGKGAGLFEAADAGADAVMGAFNFLTPGHDQAFRHARAKGAAIVAIAPLAQGLYRRGFFEIRSVADAWRVARAVARNRELLSRARAMAPILDTAPGLTPAQVALAFVHANPDINVAVTTTTHEGRLCETLAGVGLVPPASTMAALRALKP